MCPGNPPVGVGKPVGVRGHPDGVGMGCSCGCLAGAATAALTRAKAAATDVNFMVGRVV